MGREDDIDNLGVAIKTNLLEEHIHFACSPDKLDTSKGLSCRK
jgi:hypothetical protein